MSHIKNRREIGTIAQCATKTGFVHHRTTTGVNQGRSSLHRTDVLLTHKSLGLWNPRSVQADNVGAAEQFVEVTKRDLVPLRFCRGKMRVMGNHTNLMVGQEIG